MSKPKNYGPTPSQQLLLDAAKEVQKNNCVNIHDLAKKLNRPSGHISSQITNLKYKNLWPYKSSLYKTSDTQKEKTLFRNSSNIESEIKDIEQCIKSLNALSKEALTYIIKKYRNSI